ncbi:hypothetical protein QVD17_38442 [Tagetes erecta]|uniref:Uncharacterized protein n=1 Tax=Tagetes erecta TaxID=13708 RepID=A0AAD8NEA2_TARER|nr:hypothetical protein QVD17_38442 [Tagetes erecta]
MISKILKVVGLFYSSSSRIPTKIYSRTHTRRTCKRPVSTSTHFCQTCSVPNQNNHLLKRHVLTWPACFARARFW